MTKPPVPTEFAKLQSAYKRLMKIAHGALGPGKTQAQRNQVRDALGGYLHETEASNPVPPNGAVPPTGRAPK